MFGRRPKRYVWMRQQDGTVLRVRAGDRSCEDKGHQPCALCRYPRWYATLTEEEREQEWERTEAARDALDERIAREGRAAVLGGGVRTVTLRGDDVENDDVEDEEDDDRDDADRLQDACYAACEAAAALAVAELQRRGVRRARIAERAAWSELMTLVHA